jgi:hypothetical protein
MRLLALILVVTPIFVIAYYSFSLSVVPVRQISQDNGKSLKTGVLYFLGFTSELLSQFSLRFAGWINVMNAA